MIWRAILLHSVAGLGLFSSGGCGTPEPPSRDAAAKNTAETVLVTSWPLLEFARTVAGPDLVVEYAAPKKTLSRSWRPSAASARRMQQASRLLLNGAGYEPWQDRVSLPPSRVTDTSEGYADQLIRVPDAVVHQHGPSGTHSHPGTVWATWLDPELAMSQVRQVELACTHLRPSLQAEFLKRAARLQAELQQADDLVVALSKQKLPEGFRVLGDGPFYLYLTRRLGWELTYCHWPEESDALSDDHREELRQLATGGDAIFLMQAGRDAATADWVESTGLRVVRIDVCEKLSDNAPSISERMKSGLRRLSDSLQTHRSP